MVLRTCLPPSHLGDPLPDTPAFTLRCFGTPELLEGAPPTDALPLLSGSKVLLILACLEANPNGVSREVLASLGWGDQEDVPARNSLRQSLFKLRQLLGAESISRDGDPVRLAVTLASDRAVFLAAIASGDDATACAEYRGPFLDGLESPDADGLDSWHSMERARFEILWRDAALRLGRAHLNRGDSAVALALATKLVTASPATVAAWALQLDSLTGLGQAGSRREVLAQLEVALRGGVFDPPGMIEARALVRRHGRSPSSPQAGSEGTSGADLPLVGRGALLARLVRMGMRGEGPDEPFAVVLEGSAGLGKTRILREVVAQLTHRQVEAVQVSALASERRTRWSLLTRVVRALVERPGALGIEARHAAVLAGLDPDIAEHFPSVPQRTGETSGTAELASAVGDLCSTLHAETPLVLLLDDLHFGDLESLGVLSDVIGRVAADGVRAIANTRPGQQSLPSGWARWQLTPLDRDDLALLMDRSIAGLPPAAHGPLVEQVLLVTGGIPLYVRRVFQLLTDEGLLRQEDGAWVAPDPQALMRVVPKLSLDRDPRFPADLNKQSILGYLAVAEEPVGLEELQGGLPGSVDLISVLERLSQDGWVHFDLDGEQASVAHAFFAEQVDRALPPETRIALQLRRARWLAHQGTTLAAVQAAVRLFAAARRPNEAVAAVRSWRRRSGRRTHQFAERLVPDGAGTVLRWQLRLAASRGELIYAATAAMGLLAIGLFWSWWQAQPVQLLLENSPSIDAAVAGSIRRLNAEMPVFSVRDRRNRVSTALDGQPLSVQLLGGIDSIQVQDAPIVHNGRVDTRAVTFWVNDRADSSLATFSIGDVHSQPVILSFGWDHFTLRLDHGVLAGQSLEGPRPSIEVRAGARIDGVVALRYSTPSMAVTYMLAETSTMAAPIGDTLSVASLHPRTRDAEVAFEVSRFAPSRPGTYWLIWTAAAETGAVWILSRTNWKCGTPIWDDGNEVAMMPDSLLALAWGGGYLDGVRRLCDPPPMPTSQQQRLPAVTVRVVVVPK